MNLSYIEICIIVFEKCIDNEIFLKYENLFVVIDIFKSRKIFKAYDGFWVLYVFPFPSAGH